MLQVARNERHYGSRHHQFVDLAEAPYESTLSCITVQYTCILVYPGVQLYLCDVHWLQQGLFVPVILHSNRHFMECILSGDLTEDAAYALARALNVKYISDGFRLWAKDWWDGCDRLADLFVGRCPNRWCRSVVHEL